MRNRFSKYFLLLLLVFALKTSHADEMVLKGAYYGYNIYVLNPTVMPDSFCVSEVFVNGVKTIDELHSNAFEIDLGYLKIEYGTPLEIKLIHCDDCVPKIINIEDLLPPDNFKFTTVKTKKETLVFRITGKPGVYPYEVEQYRWNKWTKLGEIDVTDTVQADLYEFDFIPHSGDNVFRIKKVDKYGEVVYSKETRYRAPAVLEVSITSSKFDEEIAFSDITDFQIFDMEGNMIMEGRDRYIKIASLPKNRYYLNYDNKTIEFKKK